MQLVLRLMQYHKTKSVILTHSKGEKGSCLTLRNLTIVKPIFYNFREKNNNIFHGEQP